MKVKRFLAAIAALLVLSAPALAATAATSGGGDASRSTDTRAQSAHRVRHEVLRNLAASHNVRLARKLARVQGEHLPRNYARKAFVKPKWVLQRSNIRLGRELRAVRRERAHYRAAFRRVPRSTLDAIASCESHGNPRAIGGGGAYRGMFQMTFHIWSAVGGHGDPAAAPASEQYYRAALVYSRYGSGQWPVCGR
jgi:hypothetical protein